MCVEYSTVNGIDGGTSSHNASMQDFLVYVVQPASVIAARLRSWKEDLQRFSNTLAQSPLTLCGQTRVKT
jgi:hypothetical protein